MNLFTFAWRNLLRRPSRSLLTVSGMGIAVTAVVALFGVADSLQNSFLALYQRRGVDLVVQRRGGAVELTKGLPAELGARIRALSNVQQVIAGLMDMVSFEEAGLFLVIVNGWEADCPVLDRVNVISGRRFRPEERRCVMLGRILAANLGKKVGDPVEIYGQPFEVVGVFESFSVFENGAVFMPLSELQSQMDRKGQVTGFVVQARDRERLAGLRTEIESLNSEIAATPCTEFVGGLSQMRVARTMAILMSVVTAIVGALGVLNASAMSVLERHREIGTLRAMGWTPGRVFRLIVIEALFPATGGIVIGVVAGCGVLIAASHVSPTSNLLQGDLSPTACALGAIIAWSTALLGAAGPAYRAANQPPATAMRGA